MHRPVHPKFSMNEKLVVMKIVDCLTINYGIVLSSVLFGMVLSFALIGLISFCNSIFIQMKFKRKTFFSKFYFSNLVIC